ncbi:hypothetical protein SAMN00777080_2710 [Aquiflexum balticum DSM 16537]|uniref:Uncharacterized protein n=1 Tax=Aquiflexum balticum DSM 16537 TaxID=758820 RepID=A0A1W2H582_9BACT|nr:hypothetical protein [Aquiflexum balticum]SMD44095.1 hypothetical protein SAMN00777080_2710 [Aquiflexum balticum DSM 16537]
MKRKSMFFLAIFAAVVIVLTVVLSLMQVENEKKLAINFEVDRVETTHVLRSVLYDKNGNKLRLQRFVLYDYHDVKPGDLIVKEKGSEVLKVYRIDSLGGRSLHLTLNQN